MVRARRTRRGARAQVRSPAASPLSRSRRDPPEEFGQAEPRPAGMQAMGEEIYQDLREAVRELSGLPGQR